MTEQTTTKFKWTEEATAQLTAAVADIDGDISNETVEAIAAELGTSDRSVAAKLRSLDYSVALKSAKPATFSAEDTDNLRSFIEANEGKFNVHTLSEAFLGGKYTSKQLQGKLLAMELSHYLAHTPKKEVVGKYSPEQEAQIVALVAAGSCIEDIATALEADVKSIRGKLLSMLRKEVITSIPKSKNPPKDTKVDLFSGVDVANLTVAEIAEQIGKTERGVKAMLTRRAVNAKDYTAKVKATAEAAE